MLSFISTSPPSRSRSSSSSSASSGTSPATSSHSLPSPDVQDSPRDETPSSCRLYVGCVPRDLCREQIISGLKKITANMVDVIMYPSMLGGTNNRGFVFVEYETNAQAARALKHLKKCSVSDVWETPSTCSRKLSVDWAIPEMDVSNHQMKHVKVAFVRRLTVDTTEEELGCLFSMWGEVERVKKLKDFAFVHMESHEAALRAVKAMDGQLMKGSLMEVCLSKPVDRRRYRQWKQQKHLTSPTHPPRPSTSPSHEQFFSPSPSSPLPNYEPYYLSAQLNALSLTTHQMPQTEFYQ